MVLAKIIFGKLNFFTEVYRCRELSAEWMIVFIKREVNAKLPVFR
jgi:hypothetical protein